MHTQLLSHVQLFVTPWTVDHQAPLSMEFSRQEYWSGLPFPTLPSPGMEPRDSVSSALAGGFCFVLFFTTVASAYRSKTKWLILIDVRMHVKGQSTYRA